MIQNLFTGAVGVSFFTGVFMRFTKLDTYYRKKALKRFRKRLRHPSSSGYKKEINDKIKKMALNQKLGNGTIPVHSESDSEEQFFI